MENKKIMHRKIDKKLWNSYYNLLNSLEKTKDINIFYQKIIDWINQESYYFKVHISKGKILYILMDLNPCEYFLEQRKMENTMMTLKKLYKPEEKI